MNDMNDIILIEDSESDLRLMQRTLQLSKVFNRFRHFSMGAEALSWLTSAEVEAAETSQPLNLILLIDLKLPDMSGYDILNWLRARPSFRPTLRVVTSQLDQLSSIKKAYSLGAQSFLTKPVAQQDLDELIKAFPNFWMLLSQTVSGTAFPRTATREQWQP